MEEEIAQKLFGEENYKEALIIYDKLIKNQDIHLKNSSLENYMQCLCERLRYKESIELSDKLLKKQPQNTKILLNLCICYGKQCRYKEAIQYYERILNIDPDFKKNIGYYAYLLFRNGELDQAIKYFKIAITEEPKNVWYISHYALLAEEIGKDEEAIEYFEKAMNLNPKDTWLIKNYVFLYEKIYGKERAYEYYDKLIDEESHNYNLYINYSECAIINDDVEYSMNILSKINLLDMPIVLQVIYYVYFCYIDMYYDDENKFKKHRELLIEKRKKYNAYIHRDFSLLINKVMEKFSREKQDLFLNVLSLLKEEDDKNENS